jgi:hypothetical protein
VPTESDIVATPVSLVEMKQISPPAPFTSREMSCVSSLAFAENHYKGEFRFVALYRAVQKNALWDHRFTGDQALLKAATVPVLRKSARRESAIYPVMLITRGGEARYSQAPQTGVS